MDDTTIEDSPTPENNTFIPNPCQEEESASPLVLVSTGIKDYIGSFGGFNEETGEMVLELPLIYQEIPLETPIQGKPTRIAPVVQPLYAILGAINFILIVRKTTYFLKVERAEDRRLTAVYVDAMNRFLSPNVAIPTNDEVRKLTLAPK